MPFGTVANLGLAIGRQRIAVDGTVKTLTVPTVGAGKAEAGARANCAFITVETASVRWTIEGTDPVASTTGHLTTAGDNFTLVGAEALTKFKVTQEAGAAALEITYSRLK